MPSSSPAPADTLRSFECLLDEYGAKVNRLARRFTASESDAEDLTQEIFLDVYKCLASFRGESAPGTWVYRIALNHCLRFRDRARREAAHRAPDLPGGEASEPASTLASDPARRAVKRELSQQVHQALDQLSDHHKNVVVLHELHGLTYNECARILEVPVGTVKSRLSNAFRVLRGTLGTYVLGEGEAGSTPDSPMSDSSPSEPRLGASSSLKATGGSS